MWPHRAHNHTLTPEEMQAVFNQMKALIAMDVFCAYLNHNKQFHIQTIGKLHYQKLCCTQQLSGSTK
jgi:hypothetical protein